MSAIIGSKDIVIKKSEFGAKTQFLCHQFPKKYSERQQTCFEYDDLKCLTAPILYSHKPIMVLVIVPRPGKYSFHVPRM